MPYYTHKRDETDPYYIGRNGRSHADKAAAVAARADDEAITFIASYMESDQWRDREDQRFTSGEYTRVPWYGILRDDYESHYAHVSEKSGEKIAYTPDDTFGHEDRRLLLTPARYLQKYYPDLRADEVAFYVGMGKASGETLQFARTADDIARVYITRAAFESCMDSRYFRSVPDHPVRVYAAGDLSIAYIGQIGTRIIGRALVWEDRKIYTRLFGVGDAQGILDKALRNAGFTNGSVYGARLQAIDNGSGEYVMPYVDWHDGCKHVNVDGTDCFMIVRSPECEYHIGNTSGVASETPRHARARRSHDCHNCGESGVPMDDNYCAQCAEDRWTCESCDGEYFSDDDRYPHDCGDLCESCDSEHHRSCAHCNDDWSLYDYPRASYRRPDQRHTRTSADREICPDCHDAGVSQCVDCDDWHDSDDLRETHGRVICGDCRTAALRKSYAQARPKGTILRAWRVGCSDWDLEHIAAAVALAGAETAAADVA